MSGPGTSDGSPQEVVNGDRPDVVGNFECRMTCNLLGRRQPTTVFMDLNT